MTLTDFLATFGATVSAILGLHEWNKLRPRINVLPGEVSNHRFTFDIESQTSATRHLM